MTEKVLYEELRPEEFVERINESPIAYLPLGTLEFHSFHMPLGADGIQAQGVFVEIAKRVGGIVLPMLFLGPDRKETIDGENYYGMDSISFEEGKPQKLAGNGYYISEETFDAIMMQIADNMARCGFKILVAHGHGPSHMEFTRIKEQIEKKYGLICYTMTDLGYEGREGIQTDHAAFNETTLTMGLRPELVDITKLDGLNPPPAVWGMDPRGTASCEEGRRIISKNADRAAEILRDALAKVEKPCINLNYDNVQSKLEE